MNIGLSSPAMPFFDEFFSFLGTEISICTSSSIVLKVAVPNGLAADQVHSFFPFTKHLQTVRRIPMQL